MDNFDNQEMEPHHSNTHEENLNPGTAVADRSTGQIKVGEDDAELHCVICMEMFIKAVTVMCSHTFCEYCIKTWRKTSILCPICREEIVNFSPTLVLDNLINKIVENADASLKERREHIINERSTATFEVQNSPFQIFNSQRLNDHEGFAYLDWPGPDDFEQGDTSEDDSDEDRRRDLSDLHGQYIQRHSIQTFNNQDPDNFEQSDTSEDDSDEDRRRELGVLHGHMVQFVQRHSIQTFNNQDRNDQHLNDQNYSNQDLIDQNCSDQNFNDQNFNNQDCNDQNCSDQDCSNQDLIDQDCSDQNFNDQDCSNQDFNDQDCSNQDCNDQDFNYQYCSDQDCSNQDFNYQDCSDQDFNNQDCSDQDFNDQDYYDQDYYDQL